MSQAPTESAARSSSSRPDAWVLSGGARGMENQAMALAEAAGYTPLPLRLDARAPWRWLPEAAWPLWGTAARRLSPENRRLLEGPLPQLAIGCGRLSVPVMAWLRRMAGPRIFTVQCQDPRVSPALFDLVVPPEHDAMPPADNILPLTGSPNLALPWRLKEAAETWRATFSDLPRPLIAVAIGGPSKAYQMRTEHVDALFACLEKMVAGSGGSLAITASRRTGPENEAVIKAHADRLGAWLWDGDGPSPILGLYALADAVVVTQDSVNMAAEVAASGTPLYVAPLEPLSGARAEKFEHFHDTLRARGIARELTGELDSWTYPPLTETLRAAAEIRTRMAARGFTLPPERR